MKFYGKYKGYNQRIGTTEITFKIPTTQMKKLEKLKKDDKYYSIEIKERSKRSLNQNAYMWKLLSELEAESDEKQYAWYIKALKEANAKTEQYHIEDKALETFKQGVRAVEVLQYIKVGSKRFAHVVAYIGSSQFTKAEMMKLLEVVIVWCHEYNIDTDSVYKFIEEEI